MKKWIVGIAAAAIVSGVAFLGYRNHMSLNPPSDKPVVKIGAILPLTGNLAHTGDNVRKVLANAADRINADPNRIFTYRLVIEDNQLAPAKTVTAANKLMSYDKVPVILTVYSPPADAIKAILNQRKVIHFSYSFTENTGDNAFHFNNCLVTSQLARGAADFIRENEKKNIALVFANTFAGYEMEAKLKPLLAESAVRSSNYFFNIGERDFHILVAKLKRSAHDLILLYGFSPEVFIIGKELRQQRANIPVLGFNTLEVENYQGEFFDGFYELGNPDNQAWAREMGLSSSYVADYLYDTINILIASYEGLGQKLGRIPTADELRDHLYASRTYAGVVGEITLDDSGQFYSTCYLKQIVGNGLKILK